MSSRDMKKVSSEEPSPAFCMARSAASTRSHSVRSPTRPVNRQDGNSVMSWRS